MSRALDAAQRFARFSARPEIQRIVRQYYDWIGHRDGCLIYMQLSGLAFVRMANRITRSDYRTSVQKLARQSGLPREDFRLLAQHNRELVRCMLAGSEQIAFTPREWDAEEGDMQ